MSRGQAYLERKMWDEAITNFSRAIKLDPTKDVFFRLRANAYIKKTMWDEAITDFSRAIKLDPNKFNFRGRAIAYQALGMWDEALADFSRAIEMDPCNEEYITDRQVCIELREFLEEMNATENLNTDE